MMRLAAFVVAIAASASPAGAGATPALPEKMTGTWGWDADACAKPGDDGRLIVRASSLEFAASSWQLEAVEVSEGVFRATASVHEEGDVDISTRTISLRLPLPDRLSVSMGDEPAHTYVRCGS